MLQKTASLAFLSGLAALSQASYFFLLGRGYNGPQGAAILGTVLALIFSGSLLPEIAALAACAAALISGLVLLPLLGVKITAAIGILLLAGGIVLKGCRFSSLDVQTAWIFALAAGASVAWARCFSLLMGHSHYAFTLTLSALFLGLALGAWLKKHVDENFESAPWREGLALLLAGAAGLLALRFFRFIGINAGGAHYIQFHLHTRADVFFIAGQVYAAIALWALALSYATTTLPPSKDIKALPVGGGYCLALTGPLAGYGLLTLLGPAKTAAIFNLAMIASGFFRIGWSTLLKTPVLAQASAAIAAIAIGLTAANPEPFRDIWLNRLNAAYPGGSFLFLNDDGQESLGVYRFSTGAKVLLSEGIASFSAEEPSKRAAFLPLLLRPAMKNALLLGVRDPAVLNALASQSISLDAVDPHPGYPSILKALDEKINLEPHERLAITKADFRRHLRRQGPGYDLIFLELPGPLETAPNAFKTTIQFFSLMKPRLNAAGVALLRLPAYAPEQAAPLRIVRTLQNSFKHVIGCRLGNNILYFASDEPFDTQHEFLQTRISSDLWIFDPGLESYLKELAWLDEEKLQSLSAPLHPQSDDRPLNAFPLRDILFAGDGPAPL